MKELFFKAYRRVLRLTTVEHNGETFKLSADEKNVYFYLASLSTSFEQVRPSLANIVQECGLSSEQVARRCTQKLAAIEWISIVERKGSPNAYLVKSVSDIFLDDETTPPPDEQATTEYDNEIPPLGEESEGIPF